MQVSESEVRDLTGTMRDAHADAMPRMHEALESWRDEGVQVDNGLVALTGPTSRRGFLLGSGAILGSVAVVAATGGKASALGRVGRFSGRGARVGGQEKLTGDLAVVALAAALENLAVQTYQSALDAAQSGALGAVPPAVAEFVTTAQSQHKDHAAAWNGVLTGAGKQEVTGVDLTVKEQVVDPALAQVKDVPGVARLALDLENSAAATYLAAIDVVKSPAGIATAATIHPVELQHAAILSYVLGEYPVPDTFAQQEGARSPSDMIG